MNDIELNQVTNQICSLLEDKKCFITPAFWERLRKLIENQMTATNATVGGNHE